MPLTLAQSNSSGRKLQEQSRETQNPTSYIAVANALKNHSPLSPHHTLSCSSKYYTNEWPRFKVPKECTDWTSQLFLGRQIHHGVAQLLSKKMTSNIHWWLGAWSLDAWLFQYSTLPHETTHQGQRTESFRKIHIQSVPDTEGAKI